MYGQANIPVAATNAASISAGGYHSLMLRTDGTVLGWGQNTYGQASVPASATGVVAIAGGIAHSVALRSDGTLVSWGWSVYRPPAGVSNAVAVAAGGKTSLVLREDGLVEPYGLYGTGNPVFVPAGTTNVVAIAAGTNHDMALKADGSVMAWGDNSLGQTNIPANATNAVAIASGANHCLALLMDGTVVAWGDNRSGQTNVPVAATNVVAVSAGQLHSLALRADGSLVAWGDSTYGQCNIPSSATNVTAIASGALFNLAIVGTGAPSITIQPSGRLAAGGVGVAFRVAAVGSSPLAYRWLGNGLPMTDGAQVSGAGTATLTVTAQGLADGLLYSVVVSNALGSVTSSPTARPSLAGAMGSTNLTWATGGDGAWFEENNLTHGLPYAVRSGFITDSQSSWISAVAVGPGLLSFWWKVSSELDYDYLTCSIDGVAIVAISGEVDWQTRSLGLQPGTHTVQWTYTKDPAVSTGQDAGWLGGVSFAPGLVSPLIIAQPGSRGVAPGQAAALSVIAQGSAPLAYQWLKDGAILPEGTNSTLPFAGFQAADAGNYSVVVTNTWGAVASQSALVTETMLFAWGDNSSGQCIVPAGLSNVVAVACGTDHTLALREDGTVVAWGSDAQGQIDVPPGLGSVVAIAAGDGASLALRSDGSVVGWGSWGELYPGPSPVTVPRLTNAVAVRCGECCALAVKSDGTGLGWGPSPGNAVPAGLSNIVSVAGGFGWGAALTADGAVSAWGNNELGQLNVPTNLPRVVELAAGGFVALALSADGTVSGWGEFTNPPSSVTNVVALAAGMCHCLALRADGTVVAWANDNWGNNQGQIDVPPTLGQVIAIEAGGAYSVALLGTNTLGTARPAVNLTRTAAGFSCQLPTQSGRVYALEYKQSLADPNWVALPLVPGSGGLQTFLDPGVTSATRFYRIRTW